MEISSFWLGRESGLEGYRPFGGGFRVNLWLRVLGIGLGLEKRRKLVVVALQTCNMAPNGTQVHAMEGTVLAQ